MRLFLKVNGEEVQLDVEPAETLLRILRDRLGFLGVREGCSTGECGACAVLLDGKPVPSCLVLAADVAGSEVVTVEGIARTPKGAEIAQSFCKEGAIQCGFCTSGFVVSTFALAASESNHRDVTHAVEGHLCRCTGYKKILEAVRKVVDHDPFVPPCADSGSS